MNSGSIHAKPAVIDALHHTDNEVENVEKSDCSAINDNIIPGQSNKIGLLKILFYALGLLFLCCAVATCMSWVMGLPTLIFLGGFIAMDLYLEKNNLHRPRHYA